ncbi:hypothetical protein R0J93_27120, partial [Pseudoalteromonas sp. SIMBA_148]
CVPGITHIRQPYWFAEGRGKGSECPESEPHSRDDFGRLCAEALDARIQELGPDNVAAFLAEPVQGAGGAIMPPDSYWPAI